MGDLLNGGHENLVVPTDIRKIQQQDDTSVLFTVLERLLLVSCRLKPLRLKPLLSCLCADHGMLNVTC